MPRKLVVMAAMVCGFALADPASAVLSSASIVLTDHGQAIPGATLTLSRPHHRRARAVAATPSPSQQPTQPTPQQTTTSALVQTAPPTVEPTVDQEWVVAKSDAAGRVLLQFDDRDAMPDTDVDLIVTYQSGATVRRFNVAIETIRNGGALEITAIGTATVEPAAATPPAAQLALIPAPPVLTLGSSRSQAEQDLTNPERAYDPATGRTLLFDRDRKSWIDPSSGQALGFEGALAADGTIVPAPPVQTARSGAKHQARQDKSNPERATDSVTGRVLVWDRNESTWIDTKTGKPVGFQGVYLSGSPVPGAPPPQDLNGSSPPAAGFGFGPSFGFGSGSSSGSGSGGGASQMERPQGGQTRTIPPKQ